MKSPNPIKFITPEFRRSFVLMTFVSLLFWVYEADFYYKKFSFFKRVDVVEYKISPPKKNNENQEAIEHAYLLFKERGYKQGLLDFAQLMKTNEQARKDAFTLFKEDGYTNDMTAFEKLMGVKKNTANEEAIEIAYNLFVKNGYTKDMPSFVKLMDTNAEARSHAYVLFRRGGYKKSMSAFEKLIGVKKESKKADTEVKTKKRYKTRYLIKFRTLYPKNPAFWHNLIAIPLFFWAAKPLIKTSKNKRLTSGIVFAAYVLVCLILTRYLGYYEILIWEK